MKQNWVITPFQVEDAADAVRALTSARPEYVGHFRPFPFTVQEFENRLSRRRRDQWWVIRSASAFAGFFFLRGLDEGYERPAFGIFVVESHSGSGLGRMALEHSVQWCRAQSISRLMLKVHPENERAAQMYRSAGFRSIGRCSSTQHDIMELALSCATAGEARDEVSSGNRRA